MPFKSHALGLLFYSSFYCRLEALNSLPRFSIEEKGWWKFLWFKRKNFLAVWDEEVQIDEFLVALWAWKGITLGDFKDSWWAKKEIFKNKSARIVAEEWIQNVGTETSIYCVLDFILSYLKRFLQHSRTSNILFSSTISINLEFSASFQHSTL